MQDFRNREMLSLGLSEGNGLCLWGGQVYEWCVLFFPHSLKWGGRWAPTATRCVSSAVSMQGRRNLLRASARNTLQRWMVFIWVFPCLWVCSHYHTIKHSPPGNYTDTCISSSLLPYTQTHTHANTQAHTDTDTLFCCITQHFIWSISSLGFVIVYPPFVTSTTVGYCYHFQRGALHFYAMTCCIRHCSDTSVLLSSQAPEAHRESLDRGVYRDLPDLPDPQHQPVPTYPNQTTVRLVKTLTLWTTAHTVTSNDFKKRLF